MCPERSEELDKYDLQACENIMQQSVEKVTKKIKKAEEEQEDLLQTRFFIKHGFNSQRSLDINKNPKNKRIFQILREYKQVGDLDLLKNKEQQQQQQQNVNQSNKNQEQKC